MGWRSQRPRWWALARQAIQLIPQQAHLHTPTKTGLQGVALHSRHNKQEPQLRRGLRSQRQWPLHMRQAGALPRSKGMRIGWIEISFSPPGNKIFNSALMN